MEIKSIEKLACMKGQSEKEALDQASGWLKANGVKDFSDREKGAYNAGFNAGWSAAINMINLHGLK